MNNRRPGELYLTGGNNPPARGPVPPGPFVARVDATTGKEIWRTYLENGNVSGAWVGAADLNILPDGSIPIAFGNTLVKLDGDTGRILRHVALPTGPAPPEGSNHKHLTIAPDGTLIIKNQTRATPCDIQGTLAAFQCPGGVQASPGSNICAVNPDTFEIYDDIDVPENAVTPHSITMFEGRIAMRPDLPAAGSLAAGQDGPDSRRVRLLRADELQQPAHSRFRRPLLLHVGPGLHRPAGHAGGGVQVIGHRGRGGGTEPPPR
jgi:hypothetical protein